MTKPARCPRCGSRKRLTGYGFAASPMGGYTFCAAQKCQLLLEFFPDLEGLDDDEEIERVKQNAREMLRKHYESLGLIPLEGATP